MTRCQVVAAVVVALCVACVQCKFIYGIEGYCLGVLCEDLRLDLVKLNLPDPIPPEHLFTVVAERSDKEEMALGRFSAYSEATNMYYLVTVEHEELENFYEIFTADITAGQATNTTLKLWRTAELTSIMMDTTTNTLYGVADGFMITIDPATGTVSQLTRVVNTSFYTPRLPAAYDSVLGNYFFSAKELSTELYVIVTYNVYTKDVIITPAVGGTDPISAAYPIELAWIPYYNELYALVNSNMGGGMEKIDYKTGTWSNVVVPGHFYEPYDVPTPAENKNQEGCFDPADNYWYLLMWDYTEPDFPEGVLMPWNVVSNKWASGAWSCSDDVSNWEFHS
ncbi:hypothetical protein Pelo_5543 [Pelomyxa schiedti]|nr:hypothetical protein Pelo_5543 [Pelomyxa schiedti]